MSLPTTIPAAIVETVLIRLAALFITGAGGDLTAARQAAAHMLAAYRPETEDELRIAANIMIFSFQALEALGQASAPDMPITRILRLRSGAVSLNRASAKAELRLAELQKARQQPTQARSTQAQPEPAQPDPKIEKALALVQETGTIAEAAKAKGVTWTQAHDERQRDIRIAASLKRAEARIAAMDMAAAKAATQTDQGWAALL